MKKKLGQLKENIKINRKIVVFLIGLAILGIVLGAFFIVLLKNGDKNLVKNYMGDFISNVQSSKFSYSKTFLNASFNAVFFITSIWLLGISVVGVPIILFMYFSKAFTLGFSIASFILTMKAKGCLLAFVYLVPHTIITFIVYIVLMNYAITLSIKIIESFVKKKSIDFKGIMQKYVFILLICLGVCVVMNVYESFAVPRIMQFILGIIK